MTKFQEIYDDLKKKIDDKFYKPGYILPNEKELQEIYEVSRTTVRKAVDRLVEENRVIRRKGSGLFVKPEISKQNILDMTGIIKPVHLDENEKVVIKDTYVRKASEYYSEIFGIEENELVHFVSLASVAKDNISYEKLILPVDYYPGFNTSSLKVTSIIETINMGIFKIKDIYQEFQLVESTKETSRILETNVGNPIFKITNKFIDDENKIIAVEYKMQNALNTTYTIDF
ncbi:GntR family transcriptional regulator [Ligilactobacillus agilis]|uniref:GntR family transcriptional regulator n=1 Tax=Ligilactobacillus agilis TaxID=1601 RepID=A0A6F9XL11_9LACO|nr:GntR family transcriptional regulator [Ligilactobacillus agilis]GET05942.1 GntR family transcriptional regulator [Ligilactobacillus agilis]